MKEKNLTQRDVHYLLIGQGRLGKHMTRYCEYLELNFSTWVREDGLNSLKEKASQCSHALILINDDQIKNFIHKNTFLKQLILIHCSGCLSTDLAYGVHPLGSFTDSLWSKEKYESMHFVVEDCEHEFKYLMPGFPNQHHFLAPDSKGLYHSLCVMGGNFSVLLWQKVMKELKNSCGVPKEAVLFYMNQVMSNLNRNMDSALTGPLVRNDESTILANQKALEGDAFESVYKAFVNAFKKENGLI